MLFRQPFSQYESNDVQLRNFVNRTLMLWRGTHLRKFEIYNGGWLDTDAILWIFFAKDRKVEEVVIASFSPYRCLYECSSLRKLKISACYLELDGNVQWDLLNSLELHNCYFSEHWLNQVLSSSPQLETFSFRYDDCNYEYDNLSIRSSSLKKLSIYTLFDGPSHLTISAANLEVLEFSGGPCYGYFLTNISSLTKVYIGLKSYDSSPEILEEALHKILLAIQYVVTVTLSAECFKMLGVMKDKYSVSPLSNVKLLKTECGLSELSELLCLLEIFPKLKMLIIDWQSGRDLFKFTANNNIRSEANIVKSNLLLLRTVKIYLFGYYDASIFQFIEFLLKHCAMIEKIVIQVIRGAWMDNLEDMILAAQKVVSLQRSFPSVELSIC